MSEYPINGIRTLAFLYPSSRETSKLIIKKKDFITTRVDKYYHCNSNAELARKIFREFIVRVLDIIIADRGLFILPGRAQSHIYALTRRNKIGKTSFAGIKYSFGIKSKKKDLTVAIPDIFYNLLWESAKDGNMYPKILKT